MAQHTHPSVNLSPKATLVAQTADRIRKANPKLRAIQAFSVALILLDQTN